MNDEQVQQLVDALGNALVVLLPIVVTILAYWLRQYLNVLKVDLQGRIGERNYNLLTEFIRTTIQAAEQIYELETNEQKKAFAIKLVTGFVQQHQINLSAEQIDALIEGMLRGLKVEQTMFGSVGEMKLLSAPAIPESADMAPAISGS